MSVYIISHDTGKPEARYLTPSPLKEKPDYENQKDVETYENTVVMDPELQS